MFVLARGADASYLATCEAGRIRHTAYTSALLDPRCTGEQVNALDPVAHLTAAREYEIEGVRAATAYGSQSVQDFVTISAPGLEGQSGTVTVVMEIDGTLDATGPCTADDTVRASFLLSGSVASGQTSQTMFQTRNFDRYPSSEPGVQFPTTVSGTFSFTYGVPFECSMRSPPRVITPCGSMVPPPSPGPQWSSAGWACADCRRTPRSARHSA